MAPRFQMSPIVPTIAGLLLAALWGFSVFAGWGLMAFCGEGEAWAGCAGRLSVVAQISAIFAVAGGGLMVGAWIGGVLGRGFRHVNTLLSSAVIAWIVAEGVLFVGGLTVAGG